MELNPFLTRELNDALNKKKELFLEFKADDKNEIFSLFYTKNFVITRKVHLNCFIHVKKFCLFELEYPNSISRQDLQRELEKKVILDNHQILTKFFGMDGSVVENYFVKFEKNVLEELNLHNKNKSNIYWRCKS